MKHGQRFNILTSLVAAVFILSLFSGIVAAQMPAEKNDNKAKFESTGKLFEGAKAQFENALKQFNAKNNSISKADLVEKTRDYLEKAIDHVISYLDTVKSRAELPENKGLFPFDASKNIDAHIAELQQLRTKVQQDSTTEDLRADNKQLKDIYARARLETRYDFDIILDNSIGKFIAKSDNVSARMNTQIQNFKTKGKDTSNLETISANFTNLMQEVAADQKKTEALLAVHTGFDNSGIVKNNTDALAFLKQVDDSQRETIKIMRTPSRQLQVFTREYRILSGRSNVTGQPRNQGNLRNGTTNRENRRNGTNPPTSGQAQ